nr:serine/threonine-protein kinase [Streptomyces sp. HUCO-GS316]
MLRDVDRGTALQFLTGAAGVLENPADLRLHLVAHAVRQSCPHQLAQQPLAGSGDIVEQPEVAADAERCLEQTVRWSVQVCEGLADASDVDVVHRDIKPANIMINERGNAKIVDFGLARLLDMSETHSAGATWQYAAPERWQRSPGDHLSDLYSLGCVMYEMLTGNPPFASRDADFLEVGRMHLRHNPAPPLNIRQGIPEKLSQLVMKLLAKKPEQRPQHARAVIRLIRQVEHTPEAGSDGPVRLEPVGKPHVNTDYVERIREAEQRIRRLLADNGEYHSSVIEARFTLAELTGESGDSRGAADQYETLGEDCKRFFGPTDPRALNAFAAMARWIASPA